MSQNTRSEEDNFRFLIAVAGKKRTMPPISYVPLRIEYQEDHNCTTPEFFNRMCSRRGFDLCLFLGNGYNLAHANVIDIIAKIILTDKFTGFGGIYADYTIMYNDHLLCESYSPVYDADILKHRTPLNIPFIATSSILPKFDTQIVALSLWDGLMSLMKQSVLLHIPQFLFTMDNPFASMPLATELNRINAIHFS